MKDGYFVHLPYGNKIPKDLETTTKKEVQLWQELAIIRHRTNPKLFAKKVISPWIDQAKTYYLDACASGWRSAGLLYYYSFLNLAKAYLAANRKVSGRILRSTSIYHGLSSKPQTPSKIIDFKVEIHPSMHRSQRNVFAQFYEALVGDRWPFDTPITIPISAVVAYCEDIGQELEDFYGLEPNSFNVRSVVRLDNENIWLELLVREGDVAIIRSHLNDVVTKITQFKQLSNVDKRLWFEAYEIHVAALKGMALVRVNQLPRGHEIDDNQYRNLLQKVEQCLGGFSFPFPVVDGRTNHVWKFVPKVNLEGQELRWHPVLSNYLFAFVLSTILRYHPQLFSNDDKNSFIAEAWCNQAAITTLRYFVLAFTGTRLN